MNLDRVGPGDKLPHEFNCIIELPMRGEPVKYEVDKDTGAMFVDRFLNVSMVYPCNYGYIPHTLAEDDDPVDILLPTPVPVAVGSVMRARPVGFLEMEDEGGRDVKVLALPAEDVYPPYASIQNYTDVSPDMLDRIQHFFERYKDLNPGKWAKLQGWHSAEDARREIMLSRERYEAAPVKPAF
ncbi:MAG: inorganic diphosphatase [Gammaproteobacteria bacterium]|nr:inorganic diphosphatase [Gammaproteobacteria bacterium]